jgi:hypothetical protein
MGSDLNNYQRKLALHRVMFGDFLSPEVSHSLHRAWVACYENDRTETGLVEFLCGLYLEDEQELAKHFRGDFAALVKEVFPKHRRGDEGLIPEATLNEAASEDQSCSGGLMYPIRCSDELLRLLWLATRIANAVGKKPSLKDVVAAATLHHNWMDQLLQHGFAPAGKIADFESEVESVVFHTSVHTSKGWPRQAEFARDGSLLPPFTLELTTPSGHFQPVRSANIKLNGGEVAGIAWREKPTASVQVELRELNKIEFELEGPEFGSIEVTVRGTGANRE